MRFKDWKIWLRSLPWSLRWFVILVLVRPIVDNFYFLKNISPLLSPLYLVGVLTPVLCIYAVVSYKKKDRSVLDYVFGFWSVLMLISILFLFLYNPLSVVFLEYLLKLSLPIYLFYFLRLLIRSSRDLDGVLQTFLYSCVFVVVVFVYELAVKPIRVIMSRDLERIQGNYGDVMNYSMYLTMGFLVICYFYFSKVRIQNNFQRTRNVLIVAGICILGLLKINHTATYAVFLCLVALFILFNFKTNKTAGFVIIIIIAALAYFFGQMALEKTVAPLVKTDIAVYKGEKATDRLLHGRVGRWRMMLEQFSEFPVSAQFFGMPLTLQPSYAEVSSGSHNEFVRVLFFTGYLGLITFLSSIVIFFRRLKFTSAKKHFLGLGTISILLLYSVSTCPLLYPPMMYLILAVFCYLALPDSILINDEQQ